MRLTSIGLSGAGLKKRKIRRGVEENAIREQESAPRFWGGLSSWNSPQKYLMRCYFHGALSRWIDAGIARMPPVWYQRLYQGRPVPDLFPSSALDSEMSQVR